MASEVFYHHRHFPVADMPILPANQYSFCFFKMKQTWHVGSTSYMTSYFHKDYRECEWWQIYTYFSLSLLLTCTPFWCDVIVSGTNYLTANLTTFFTRHVFTRPMSFKTVKTHNQPKYILKFEQKIKLNIWKCSNFLTVIEGKKIYQFAGMPLYKLVRANACKSSKKRS